MGLFVQRPEEPTEWAGLPSEPLRDETASERLPDAPSVDVGAVDAAAVDLGGVARTGVESIVVPVTPFLVAGEED